MRQVNSWDELQQPGDYLLTTRCNCCDAHGDHKAPADGGEIRYHYGGCTQPEAHTGFVLWCKCGYMFASHRDHRVLNRNPLTVRASWLCPNGCHAFITDGEWRDC